MNFNDGWIEVFASGKHIDNNGREHSISSDFLEAVVRNYDPTIHEAPAVIGHPHNDSPAYGWTRGLKIEGGRLLVQFADVNPEFEEGVKQGSYKKRSASFYVDSLTAPGGRAPYLRHVGFLGAQPPAVKGLRDIQFREGDALTFETTSNYSEGESMNENERKGFVADIIDGIKNSEWFKSLLPKKDEPASLGASASFTEADKTALVAEAVKQATAAMTASFAEEKKALETQLTALQTQFGQQSSTSTHKEIVSFCDSLGKDVCPPAFLNMGLVGFMESLATSDQKVTVISFEEGENKQKVEKKTETSQLDWFKGFLKAQGPFIQFGEDFRSIVASGHDDATAPDPKRMNALREMGQIPTKEVRANA